MIIRYVPSCTVYLILAGTQPNFAIELKVQEDECACLQHCVVVGGMTCHILFSETFTDMNGQQRNALTRCGVGYTVDRDTTTRRTRV